MFKMYKHLLPVAAMAFTMNLAAQRTFKMADYGVRPGADSLSVRIDRALQQIRTTLKRGEQATVRFDKGTYRFVPEESIVRDRYISNHDQCVHYPIALNLEAWDGLTVDGAGSLFLCTGRMLPVSLQHCRNVDLRNLSIDFETPHIAQVEITANDENGMRFRPADEVKWRINADRRFEAFAPGWTLTYSTGIAFDGAHHYIVPQTADLWADMAECSDAGNGEVLAPKWKDRKLTPGTRVALRSYYRPAPAISVDECKDLEVKHVTVHYAEGMGIVAQRTDGVHLDGFNVVPNRTAGRYYTTQADATHFVQCKGMILVENGTFEGMMDDAINIHGAYLRVRERIDDHTLRLRFEHDQSYGYNWGDAGDTVSIIRSATMDRLPGTNVIEQIRKNSPKEFTVRFRDALPAQVTEAEGYGVENLTWTPEAVFRKCTVRNNRARGALFSSPRRTVCEDNLFDHTSGTAVLLCGDCNGWYESGAVRDLTIRRNKFVNALTSLYQFTEAVISIYPEIPQLDKAETYFHGGKPGSIRIEGNTFETFESPLIYAKSTDGIIVKGNRVKRNQDFEPFHHNRETLKLEHCKNVDSDMK